MRVTVCELPHQPAILAEAFAELCAHTREQAPDLVLLPELAFVPPLWEAPDFDATRWAEAEVLAAAGIAALGQLGARHAVGTRPMVRDGRRLNEGFLWSRDAGIRSLRAKHFMPAEPGGWETAWFDRGDPEFPAFRLEPALFGLNICTELWALESYASYAEAGAALILAPRATAAATRAKWLAAGTVGAVRAGAFMLSSNRVEPTGACGGSSWIISPDGQLLAATSPQSPFATVELDLAAAGQAQATYPRYVFRA